MPPRPRALDALAFALSAVPGILLWHADRRLAPDPSLPRWATLRDTLLVGPDAGAWASSATALSLGRTEDLDPHRLPVLPRLIALMLHLEPDVALAGHLLNHGLHLLLGPVLFLLGRRWMGAGMALGAATVAVTYGPTVFAADRYGVDPLVTLLLPASLLAADVAARHPRWSPLLGLVIGTTACAHLTTIGIGVPALVLASLRVESRPDRGLDLGRRALVVLGLTLGGGAAAWAMFHDYPVLEWGRFTGSLAEGVSPGAGMANQAQLSNTANQASEVVRGGLPGALSAVVGYLATTTRPWFVPWGVALVFPWLGLLGLGLEDPERLPRGSSVFAGLRAGLPLAGALVPLIAFASAGSPLRYSVNYQGLGCLLMFRGMASVLAMVRLLLIDGPRRNPALARTVRKVPLEAPSLVLGMLMAAALWSPIQALAPIRLPPSAAELADRALGQKLLAQFGPGGGGFCARREVMAYAGRSYCPRTLDGPSSGDAPRVQAHLAAECGGVGPIPFVVTDEPLDHGTAPLAPTIAWVEANVPLSERFTSNAYSARIYAVERP